jgi:hypothetical protein
MHLEAEMGAAGSSGAMLLDLGGSSPRESFDRLGECFAWSLKTE